MNLPVDSLFFLSHTNCCVCCFPSWTNKKAYTTRKQRKYLIQKFKIKSMKIKFSAKDVGIGHFEILYNIKNKTRSVIFCVGFFLMAKWFHLSTCNSKWKTNEYKIHVIEFDKKKLSLQKIVGLLQKKNFLVE